MYEKKKESGRERERERIWGKTRGGGWEGRIIPRGFLQSFSTQGLRPSTQSATQRISIPSGNPKASTVALREMGWHARENVQKSIDQPWSTFSWLSTKSSS